MRLAISLRLYVKGKIGGMENYIRQVVAGIARRQELERSEWTVFGLESELGHIREFAPGANLVAVTHENADALLHEALGSGSYDLLFCPLLVLDPLEPRIPSIVAIPDLQHEFHPEYFDRNTLAWRRHTFGRSASHADAVFTLSEHSKRTIVDRLDADPEKVVIVPLDVDPEFREPISPETQRVFSDLKLPQKYVYFPANFWKHKNHSMLLRAMKRLIERDFPELALVLTGAPSTGMDRVQAEAASLSLARNVHFLSYQPKPVTVALHHHALALAFVSEFEGFGIPILEAFHTGTPVVASQSTSCPEVAGDAAILVDEQDPSAIAKALRTAISDQETRTGLIERGRTRAQQYTWDAAVQITLKTFDIVLADHRRLTAIEVHQHPVVSIVTPTYNMGRFLEETIQSVLSQDYPYIDYIVMDGGSTDGTLDILRRYGGRLRYSSGPDGGQAAAVNEGFKHSRGDIFTFLNADDTYLPGAVGIAAANLERNPKAGVVYGDAYHVHEDGSMMGPYPTRPFDYQTLSQTCFICQPASFMSRKAFMEVGGLDESFHLALDYDLWMRIAKRRPFMKVAAYLATSRMYRENKTVSKRRQVYQEIIRAVKKNYGFVPYDWIYNYSDYLVDRKDQVFEVSQPSPAKKWVALALGSQVNVRHLRRYWTEWFRHTDLGPFTGRWGDGWISETYRHEILTPAGSERIVVRGRHAAPFEKGLTIHFHLNGKRLETMHIPENGTFQSVLKCPPEAGARGRNRFTIRCDQSFSPTATGDHRKLSCLIDSITVEPGQPHETAV